MKRHAGAVIFLALAAALVSGCGSGDDGETGQTTPVATATPKATATPVATIGPIVSFLGLTRADSTLLQPSSFAPDGIPIYIRSAGSGFSIVVEGRRGPSGAAVGESTYREDVTDFPDLQIISSNALGNGSEAVCDNVRPNDGGVPGTSSASFTATAATIRAVNDFACRFRDGQGQPRGVGQQDACVQFPSGDYQFVDPTSTIQFCGVVTRVAAFHDGDSLVTVRLRDTEGFVGPSAQLIIRVEPLPTPIPSATPIVAPTPVTSSGPAITFFGITRADGTLVEATDSTEDDIPIFVRRSGFGFSLVVEGAPGTSGAAVSPSAYQSDLVTFPDLQIQVSRDLGNGSTTVCDVSQPRPDSPVLGGGVPGIDPASFELTEAVIAAVNDLACRFRDGQGNPIGRGRSESCVLFPSGDFNFVEAESSVQFCGFIDGVLAFPAGDTLITARLRDVNGNVGLPSTIIVRVI
jgi:hypothetical protein